MNRLVFFIFIMLISAAKPVIAGAEILEINIKIENHHFIPDVIKVPAGKKIKLMIYNADSMIEEFESSDLKREKILLAGKVTNVILAPLQSGVYHFMGEFHAETAKGKIIVE